MKLHDLQPAEGSRKDRIRVGRGIAAGKGKTAGRGTKGQKARAGGGIPAWFEGGQTPLHMRIPKLRGFKNRFRVEYEVVNVGSIDALVARGAFEQAEAPAKKGAKGGGQITVNQDILRAVGLVRTLNKPLKILGAGELTVPLFVVADAFTASARAKIEAAGGVSTCSRCRPVRWPPSVSMDRRGGCRADRRGGHDRSQAREGREAREGRQAGQGRDDREGRQAGQGRKAARPPRRPRPEVPPEAEIAPTAEAGHPGRR